MVKFFIPSFFFLTTVAYSQSTKVDPQMRSELRLHTFSLNDKMGAINGRGDTLIAPVYDGLRIKGDFIEATKDGKQGLISRKNEIMLPFVYDFVLLKNDVVNVVKDKKEGIVTPEGEVLVPIIYDVLENIYADSIYRYLRNNGWGWLTMRKEITPPKYKGVSTFYSEGKAPVFLVLTDKGLQDLRDKNDSASLIPKGYQAEFCVGSWLVLRGELGKGILNTDRKFAIDPIYDDVRLTSSPYCRWYVKRDGKYGIVDACTGKVCIRPMYDDLSSNFGDYYAFRKNEGESKKCCYGVVDSNNKIVVPFSYNKVDSYNGEFIVVEKDKKFGAFDRNGKVILKMKYDDLEAEKGMIAHIYQVGNKFGYVYENGTFMTGPIFDDAGLPRLFHDSKTCLSLKKDGEFVCLMADGKIVLGECKE